MLYPLDLVAVEEGFGSWTTQYDPQVPFARGNARRFTENQWRYYMYDYFRMIEKLNDDVGRMMDAVTSRGDDTVIIFIATTARAWDATAACRNGSRSTPL
ncbi:MAG: hypothetical protein M1541_18705 [Acidobacteria bacterium]|nr:hypothetical protein [Acidobacteriota bacterium]